MQEEVKRFLREAGWGWSKRSPASADDGTDEDTLKQGVVAEVGGYFELEKRAGMPQHEDDGTVGETTGRDRIGADGRVVDVVLSDMSAPWEQTDGFWKRSLSDPYYRMMNTSGISFRDHAGSMVRLSPIFHSPFPYFTPP